MTTCFLTLSSLQKQLKEKSESKRESLWGGVEGGGGGGGEENPGVLLSSFTRRRGVTKEKELVAKGT